MKKIFILIFIIGLMIINGFAIGKEVIEEADKMLISGSSKGLVHQKIIKM